MDRFKAITDKTQQVLALAEKLYGVKINPSISFDLRGRVAGYAGCRFCNAGERKYFLRFNCELIQGKHFEDMRDETVPHEVAHLTAMARPDLGAKGHNQGWKKICIALGGTGERCHSYDVVVKGRWDYLTDRGNKVSVTKKYHAYVQAGGTLTFRKGLGVISKASPCAPSGQLNVDPKPHNTVMETTLPKQPESKAPKASSNTVKITNTGELTWAEKVRRLIREHKPLGVSIDVVIGLAISDLGMTRERARSCVKAHWNKV